MVYERSSKEGSQSMMMDAIERMGENWWINGSIWVIIGTKKGGKQISVTPNTIILIKAMAGMGGPLVISLSH